MRINNLKKVLILVTVIAGLLFTAGCKTGGAGKLVLDIYISNWYTTVENGFGNVYLSITGYSNGSRVTVWAFGDGVPSEEEITLDRFNTFQAVVRIAFTHDPGNEPFEYTTTVTAYRGDDSVQIELESGELKYFD